MTRVLLDIALPRSGTNSLMKMYRAVPGVCVMGEMFNFGRDFIHPDVIEAHAGRPLSEAETEALKEEVRARLRSDPVEVFRKVHDYHAARGHDFIQAKVFPGFLMAPQLATLLREFDCTALFVYRRPVDIYISLAKARETGTFGGRDTTDIRPELDPQGFLRWWRRASNHFRMAHFLTDRAGTPKTSLTYDQLYNSGADPWEVLRQAHARCGVSFPPPSGPPAPGMRQDRGTRPETKVANWPQFRAAVAAAAGPDVLERYDLNANRTCLGLQALAEAAIPRAVLRRAYRAQPVRPARFHASSQEKGQ